MYFALVPPLLFTSAFVPQCLASHSHAEDYSETLTLRPLRDGKLSASFAFTTSLHDAVPRTPDSLSEDDAPQHYTLFPLALGQILREYAITELHLNLNAGQWQYDRWGPPDQPSVASGAELWAWMGDGGSTSVDERWKGTQNALAGLFCASLGSMDAQRTTSPTRAFPPHGSLPLLPNHSYALRHAHLPSENVCTENLTPFLKLLPCPARAGIATLLNPHKLFDADWHGLGINVVWKEGGVVELKMTVQAVFDPVRTSPDGKRDWSLRSIFGRTIERACPVASSSNVELMTDGIEGYTLEPNPTGVEGGFYELKSVAHPDAVSELDLSMRWTGENKFAYPLDLTATTLSAYSVDRSMKGSSQTTGELALSVRNNLQVQQRVLWLETLPWHVELYLHTLHVICADGRPCDELLGNLTYTPPVPHASGALLQTEILLPPGEHLQISARVRKSFLRYTEHPPDAQRGWDLPPGVLVSLEPIPTPALHHSSGTSQRMYTRPLLVDLATPDFSMPYNVIIMTCTLIALCFGSVFNMLTRRFLVFDAQGKKLAGGEVVEGDTAVDETRHDAQ
ncbi:Gpi16 subunit, GPI transamidase component [Peniophora sp. CONT]|nr:Gpi16 subunit, GPI transamidase component [Peniophora sp. CONT]